jgi:hypothetical protein
MQDTAQDMLLKQLVEELRTSGFTMAQMAQQVNASESTMAQMARQVNEIGKEVTLMRQGGAVAGSSAVATPPTRMPQCSPFHAKRNGPPGTFRDPVPPPVHRSVKKNAFHVSLRSTRTIAIVLTESAEYPRPHSRTTSQR